MKSSSDLFDSDGSSSSPIPSQGQGQLPVQDTAQGTGPISNSPHTRNKTIVSASAIIDQSNSPQPATSFLIRLKQAGTTILQTNSHKPQQQQQQQQQQSQQQQHQTQSQFQSQSQSNSNPPSTNSFSLRLRPVVSVGGCRGPVGSSSTKSSVGELIPSGSGNSKSSSSSNSARKKSVGHIRFPTWIRRTAKKNKNEVEAGSDVSSSPSSPPPPPPLVSFRPASDSTSSAAASFSTSTPFRTGSSFLPTSFLSSIAHDENDTTFDPNTTLPSGSWTLCWRRAQSWRQSKAAYFILILLLLGAVFVSVFLYYYLHHQEHLSFRSTLSLLCTQRTRTFVDHLKLAVQSMSALGGMMSVQNSYFYSRHWVMNRGDWYSYVNKSLLPTFLDQTVWMPKVDHSQRNAYENITGHPISELACLNPSQNLTYCIKNPPNISDPYSGLDFFRPRVTRPYYFPYQFFYPNFSGPYPILHNIDATFLFPFQGILFSIVTNSIALGDFTLSGRNPLKAAKENPTQPQWGSIAIYPIFDDGFQITSRTDGNVTANWPGLIGVVVVIIRMSLVLQLSIDSLGGTAAAPLRYTLYDKSAKPANSFVASNVDPLLTDISTSENATVPFSVGQRDYALECLPSQSFIDQHYSSTPLFISIGSAILIFVNLLFVLMALMYTGMRRAVQRAKMLAKSNADKSAALSLLAEAKELAERATQSKTVPTQKLSYSKYMRHSAPYKWFSWPTDFG